MGPVENRTSHPARRAARRPTPASRRPRMRRCLLKGCEQCFRPRQARQRYCSERCQEAAREWSRWRAQQRYRATTSGKQRRNGQSQRYRKRIQSLKPAQPEAVDEAARVITKNFFRALLRPARLRREIRARAAKSLATLLLASVQTCAGTCRTAGEALETGARVSPEILIRHRSWPYIQPVECKWSFTNSTGGGSDFESAIQRGSGGCWRRWPTAASKHPSWWWWRWKARRTVTWSSTAISGSRRWSNWAGTRWKLWCGR